MFQVLQISKLKYQNESELCGICASVVQSETQTLNPKELFRIKTHQQNRPENPKGCASHPERDITASDKPHIPEPSLTTSVWDCTVFAVPCRPKDVERDFTELR